MQDGYTTWRSKYGVPEREKSTIRDRLKTYIEDFKRRGQPLGLDAFADMVRDCAEAAEHLKEDKRQGYRSYSRRAVDSILKGKDTHPHLWLATKEFLISEGILREVIEGAPLNARVVAEAERDKVIQQPRLQFVPGVYRAYDGVVEILFEIQPPEDDPNVFGWKVDAVRSRVSEPTEPRNMVVARGRANITFGVLTVSLQDDLTPGAIDIMFANVPQETNYAVSQGIGNQELGAGDIFVPTADTAYSTIGPRTTLRGFIDLERVGNPEDHPNFLPEVFRSRASIRDVRRAS